MFGKFCLRVFVGLVVFVLIGRGDALGMLFMAVVCTAGVGLIVVIPAAYLIGLLCTIWFIPFGNRDKEPKEGSPQSPERHPTEPAKVGWKYSKQGRSALHDYIGGASSKGQEWQAVRSDLIGLGWDAEIVDKAGRDLGLIKENDNR